MNDRQVLIDGLEALGLTPGDAQVDKLHRYVQALEKWNRVYNLTAIPAGDRTITHHLLDALSIIDAVDETSILDVGSGGGLPGIPLAICKPHGHFTLLDSAGKKTRFLEHVRIMLGLRNLEVVQARVEAFSGQFDQIVCRGLGSLAEIVHMTAHLLAPSGRILAMKGAIAEAELGLVEVPFQVERVQPLSVPGLEAQRCLVVLRGPGS